MTANCIAFISSPIKICELVHSWNTDMQTQLWLQTSTSFLVEEGKSANSDSYPAETQLLSLQEKIGWNPVYI